MHDQYAAFYVSSRATDIPFLSLVTVPRDPDESEEEIDEKPQYEVSFGLQSWKWGVTRERR